MNSAGRMPLVDALKAIASQLIVLHHLSAYGPLSAAAHEALPGTMEWLYDYARIAVQVFLAVAGFLAARGLAADGRATFGNPLALIWRRYLRLALPYFAALALAIAGAALADVWLDDEAIPAPPHLVQLVAHALLLHSLLGADALSAGMACGWVWFAVVLSHFGRPSAAAVPATSTPAVISATVRGCWVMTGPSLGRSTSAPHEKEDRVPR